MVSKIEVLEEIIKQEGKCIGIDCVEDDCMFLDYCQKQRFVISNGNIKAEKLIKLTKSLEILNCIKNLNWILND